MAKTMHILENMNFNILLGNLNINVINLTKVIPDENWFVADHAHLDFEFHIIPLGRGYINIEGVDVEVNAGELYVTGPFVRHRQLSDKKSPMMEYCLECEINVLENIPEEYENRCTAVQNKYTFSKEENLLLRNTLSKPHPCIFKDSFNIAGKFEEILEEAKERNIGFFLKIQTLIVDMVIALLRTVSSAGNNRYIYDIPQKPVNKFRIERLVKFVEVNYKNSITLEDASKVLFLSPRQINRLMKKTFNMTFHDYLLNYRFLTAKRLLSDTGLSIEEVAYESGFSSHYYMYQVFKHLGSPPPARLRSIKEK